ncbi:hypothetical protein [Curvibacter gracilis]|uniref:hypothetical protein n=1 Tax=Curvibacter gracilis TaxID=230310 RepID=UPI0012F7DAA6|nr:hypothetical protein [Curvibacter gracilis]
MGANNYTMPAWALPAFSWLISFYFLLGFVVKMGFPPSSPMTATEGTYLFLWLFFIFLPFFKKVKIGKLLELERDVQHAKEEVKQLREQVQNNFAVMASSISTISNQSNHVTVNLPGELAAQKAKQELEQWTPSESSQVIEDIKSELILEDEDTIMSLARTRIRIEYLLRSILNKRTKVKKFGDRPVRLMGLPQLARELIDTRPELHYMENSISYVNKVCSAAIHAQLLPPGYAEEALDMGARIIAVLSNMQDSDTSTT